MEDLFNNTSITEEIKDELSGGIIGLRNGDDIKHYTPLITGYFLVKFSTDKLTDEEKTLLTNMIRKVRIRHDYVEMDFYVCKETFDLVCEKIVSPNFNEGLTITVKLMHPTGKTFKEHIYTDIAEATIQDFECGNHDIMINTVTYSKNKKEIKPSDILSAKGDTFSREILIDIFADKIASRQKKADKIYYKDNPPKKNENDDVSWQLDQIFPLKDICDALDITNEVYNKAYKLYDFRNSGKEGYELRDGIIQKIEAESGQ